MIRQRILCSSGSRHHPRFPALQFRRALSGESGENKSGHISCSDNEGIIFFNSLLPFNFSWFYRVVWSMQSRAPILLREAKDDQVGAASPADLLAKALKESASPEAEVVEVLPRLKEGGAFLKFRHDQSTDPKSVAAAVHKYLKANQVRPWWNPFASVRARLVLGKPWIEDLFILPSRRLRVEFMPTAPGKDYSEMSPEQLYRLFRPYGKLSTIVPMGSESKIMPKFAYMDYARSRKAVMAKNCLHGFTIPESQGGGSSGTILRITYEKKDRFRWIKDWIMGHSRIVVPLLAALVAGISIAIFDPIRTLFIKAHVSRTFHVEDNVAYKWFRRQGEDLLNRVGVNSPRREASMQILFDDRKAEMDQIQSWLMETTDTFIVVLGPRGSGKKELVVDHALSHKRDAGKLLVIDCKPVQEARGDAATIAAAAAQVGYRPVFSWINNVSGLLDLASQSVTGMKAGFSETLENQLVKIYNNTASALKSIALEARKKDPADKNLSDDEYLEAHPEHRPVLVVDNFLHKANEPGAQVVYDKVAEWAAQLTTTNVAHVVFLTNDISFTKSLSKALPDRVFRQIALDDASPQVAKRYVVNHLDFDASPVKANEIDEDGDVKQLSSSQKREDLSELDIVIGQLGGRLTDLDFLARRIRAGETPSRAVEEIVNQSAAEILKMFLLSGAEDRAWSSQQAWTLVKKLSGKDTLPYNEILMDASFGSGGDTAMAALEQAELITVQSANGRPYSVKPGKPVYQEAFRRLITDKVLSAKMDLAVVSDAISTANKAIDGCEKELQLIGELPKQPGELYGRMTWLLSKIATNQKAIEDQEKQAAALKKILATEF